MTSDPTQMLARARHSSPLARASTHSSPPISPRSSDVQARSPREPGYPLFVPAILTSSQEICGFETFFSHVIDKMKVPIFMITQCCKIHTRNIFRSQTRKMASPKQQLFKYLLILDFEATCDDTSPPVPQVR